MQLGWQLDSSCSSELQASTYGCNYQAHMKNSIGPSCMSLDCTWHRNTAAEHWTGRKTESLDSVLSHTPLLVTASTALPCAGQQDRLLAVAAVPSNPVHMRKSYARL